MTKCDFCLYSSPSGCWLSLLSDRKPKCEEAINRMIDALQGSKSCLCNNRDKELLLQHIPDPCKSCSNHPTNGGSGICNCTLGQVPVTCGAPNSVSENYSFEVGV